MKNRKHVNCIGGCCLSENTNVTMVDGNEKKINLLKPGDRVIGEDGSIHEVMDILTGFEERFLEIKLENGYKIKATPYHVFVTKENNKRAEQLQEGDLVNTQRGYSKVVQIESVESLNGELVYNLILQEGYFFYANGILNGDLNIQNQYSLKVQRTEQDLEKIKKECDEIKRMCGFRSQRYSWKTGIK